MIEDEKMKIMTDTAQSLLGMIQNRMNNRLEVLNTLAASPLDNIPNEVKEMREIESSKIRAVMQEQKDLIEIIKMLYPSSPGSKKKKTEK